ncbi:MAG: citrate synthase [Oscillospiraceae bacterium]|nr:citrate synthase [Oscillospiraceae bacterium]
MKKLCLELEKNNKIDTKNYELYNVKRGLRNNDGSGVMAGLTSICNVHGYVIDEGERSPVEGELIYRGINIKDIVAACQAENRFGFEEVAWLLLFGMLPTKAQLDGFKDIIEEFRELPRGFIDDMIIKAPSSNIMNKMARSVLALYSYDNDPENYSLDNVLRQSIEIIARMPTIMVAAYQVKKRAYDNKSMFFHPQIKGQSIAESILSTIRADRKFTDAEAKLLDLCLILHAEHGGGNNSTFSCRVLTSSGTDTYSAISAGIGSLKGPKHGGANIKVSQMLDCIKEGVCNWEDEDEVLSFINKILDKEAGDGSGLIYGMGHAVYTKSDPRAIILKESAMKLARGTEFEAEFKLLSSVEELTKIACAEKHGKKVMCANVDLYSGLVYKMLGITPDLITPLFAVSRTAGWCAHRIEEIMTGGRIIRPAYKAVAGKKEYIPIANR